MEHDGAVHGSACSDQLLARDVHVAPAHRRKSPATRVLAATHEERGVDYQGRSVCTRRGLDGELEVDEVWRVLRRRGVWRRPRECGLVR